LNSSVWDWRDEGIPSRLFWLVLLAVFVVLPAGAQTQTAAELVAQNIQAKGGLEKIKAVQTLRLSGRSTVNGRNADISVERKRRDMVRENFTRQRLTRVRAYDGKVAWQIQPFRGDKEPQLMGEDEARALLDDADIDGPLLDYEAKGNRVEYLGHDLVDGDDAYKLKVTLRNGDIIYYYLDPDTYLEVRRERQEFIRGNLRETQEDLGSYKQAGGVYYASSLEITTKGERSGHARIDIYKIEVNVPIDDAEFEMPATK
jgi:outer membrane lipoprotein-sorting protein